ncbi:MAG: HAD hydrolase family protein, partial [Collinsella sp.]|nr:HAD hydrolase family protein [Collinsella sp.]
MVEVASGVPNVAAGDAAALFFDVDGTIIWHRPDSDPGEVVVSGRPTEAVRSAFAELKRRGHKTFICTGRPRCLVSDALLDLEPTGLITGAGATI